MKESKQDVFDSALDELRYAISLAKEPVAAEDLSGDELLNDLRARYTAAGKVAVPREVGKAIDGAQAAHRNLSWTLQEADNRYTLLYDRAGLWITTHQDQFAEAWIHGWYAEEDAK